MDAQELTPKEKVSASRKLGKADATNLLRSASRLVVAKGKKLQEWKIGTKPAPEAVAAMLGPTGNLRAPTLKVGKTILVGFNEELFDDFFG